jgi:hypothetical protein
MIQIQKYLIGLKESIRQLKYFNLAVYDAILIKNDKN